VRDAINARIIAHKAKESMEEVTVFYAKDRMGRKPVEGDLRCTLWNQPSKVTKDFLGCLPLFRGMRVMITENIAFGRRLVNGSEGTVQKLLYNVIDGMAYATVAYVHVPGAGQVCDDLDVDIVPIFPKSKSFKVKTVKADGKCGPKRSVARTQLPLIPAYAYTDYKSQGKSLTHAIVDLESAQSLQGMYVMLSRVRTLRRLLVLRGFSAAKLCQRLSEEMRVELHRIDALAESTRDRFERSRRTSTLVAPAG
ncbi:hypothetical protein PYCCODRAFT_1367413, partial [Trametes coccinea BRFM310]